MNRQELGRNLQNTARIFGNDLLLVHKQAQEHNIPLVTHDITSKPTDGAYNAHIPIDILHDIDAIASSKKILLGCIDWRQVEPIFAEIKPDVFFTVDGGPTQPDSVRLQTLTQLFKHIHAINPHATLLFVAHDQICGGVNHFSGGQLTELQTKTTKNGTSWEITERAFLTPLLNNFYSNLKEHGIKPEKIVFALAHVDPGSNQFQELLPVIKSVSLGLSIT